MAVEKLEDIAINDEIRFKTKSPHDNVFWHGTVVSLCNYSVARQFGGSNISVYHQDVKRIYPDLPSVDALSYIILMTKTADGSSSPVVVAKEWVDESTLEKISEETHVDIRIYGIDNSKAKDIANYISTVYPDYAVEIL